jgi:hypothetical protein
MRTNCAIRMAEANVEVIEAALPPPHSSAGLLYLMRNSGPCYLYLNQLGDAILFLDEEFHKTYEFIGGEKEGQFVEVQKKDLVCIECGGVLGEHNPSCSKAT